MDIKTQVTEIAEKISKDKALQELFKKDPVKAIESVAGIDLPDDIVDKVSVAVKTKLTADNIADTASVLKKFIK